MPTLKLISKKYSPYSPAISRYRGKTIVVKYGGAAMATEASRESFSQEIVFLAKAGIRIVVVHGGGKEITAAADKLGLPTTFVQGQRYTDAAMMDVVRMVLAGKTNQDVVSGINTQGGKAAGLSGIDAGLIKAKKAEGEIDLGFVGEVVKIETSYIHLLLKNGVVPVIAPIGCDDNGQAYNINADVAAAEIARSLHADALFLLTDVDGVHAADGSLITRLSEEEAEAMISSGEINNGMIPKMRSAFASLRAGVGAVHLTDGRMECALLQQIYSTTVQGTELIIQHIAGPEEVFG